MMDAIANNPFAVASFIAAPAVLTNATSIMALSTSNRVLRCMDRIREIGGHLKDSSQSSGDQQGHWRKQLSRADIQCRMFLRSLRLIYTALACFGMATLVALVGACSFAYFTGAVAYISGLMSLLTGGTGIICLVIACFLLIRASQLAQLNVMDDLSFIESGILARA